MNLEEAVKQATRAKEQDRRAKAEKEREDKVRQHQAAELLKKLGQDVASTCRARNFHFHGVATHKQNDGIFRGITYSFTLVRRVWVFGDYQVDESGQICFAFRTPVQISGEGFRKAFERDRSKAIERFGVRGLVSGGTPLVPVTHVDTGAEYSGSEVGIGHDGQLYREGQREPLVNVLSCNLAT